MTPRATSAGGRRFGVALGLLICAVIAGLLWAGATLAVMGAFQAL